MRGFSIQFVQAVAHAGREAITDGPHTRIEMLFSEEIIAKRKHVVVVETAEVYETGILSCAAFHGARRPSMSGCPAQRDSPSRAALNLSKYESERERETDIEL